MTATELRGVLARLTVQPPWVVAHDSDLTMDGKSTPRLEGQGSDEHWLTFARGNRNYDAEARAAAAAVNHLGPLLDLWEAAQAVRVHMSQPCKLAKANSGPDWCIKHQCWTPCPMAALAEALAALEASS